MQSISKYPVCKMELDDKRGKFGENSGKELIPYTEKIKRLADEVGVLLSGWIVWSYRQINKEEWNIITKL